MKIFTQSIIFMVDDQRSNSNIAPVLSCLRCILNSSIIPLMLSDVDEERNPFSTRIIDDDKLLEAANHAELAPFHSSLLYAQSDTMQFASRLTIPNEVCGRAFSEQLIKPLLVESKKYFTTTLQHLNILSEIGGAAVLSSLSKVKTLKTIRLKSTYEKAFEILLGSTGEWWPMLHTLEMHNMSNIRETGYSAVLNLQQAPEVGKKNVVIPSIRKLKVDAGMYTNSIVNCFPNLTELSIEQAMDHIGLARLVDSLLKLEVLRIVGGNNDFDNAAIGSLKKLNYLRSLQLTSTGTVGDLGALFSETTINSNPPPQLLDTLSEFTLTHPTNGATQGLGLQHLGKLCNLQKLELAGTNHHFTDNEMRSLADSSSCCSCTVTHLDLAATNISSASLRYVREFDMLQTLRLDHCTLVNSNDTDELEFEQNFMDFFALSSFIHLKELNMRGCGLRNRHLGMLKLLFVKDSEEDKGSDDDERPLREGAATRLEALNIGENDSITDAGFAHLTSLGGGKIQLKYLIADELSRISNVGSTLESLQEHLVHLDLSGCSSLDLDSIKPLGGGNGTRHSSFPNLRTLYLYDCPKLVTEDNSVLQYLAENENLVAYLRSFGFGDRFEEFPALLTLRSLRKKKSRNN